MAGSRTTDSKIAAWMRGANTSGELHQRSLAEFYAYCEIGDWERADAARERTTTHLEVHLDNIAAVHRALKG